MTIEEIRSEAIDLLQNNFNLLLWMYLYDIDAYEAINRNMELVAILLIAEKPDEAFKIFEQVKKVFVYAYSYYLVLFKGENSETN